MGRAERTRLWIALPGGIVINGLLLAGLVLVERASPPIDDPPVIVLSLDRLETRRKAQPSAFSRLTGKTASTSVERSETAPEPEAAVDAAQAAPAKPAVDPAWIVGGGAYLTPESGARARRFWDAADQRRYQRACIGHSSEHMTPEEKDRCWDMWGGRGAAANGAGASWSKPPREEFVRQARKQERCRRYRDVRTQPGADPFPTPSLLKDGACF